jgi:hypothetical protein
MLARLSLSAALFALASPAVANDSTAQLGAGGLQLVRNDTIDVLSEDLYVSAEEVRVTYHFRNHTDEPVTYLVAFPLPTIDAIVPEAMNVQLPDANSENFMDFAASVDGEPISPKLEARVIALGLDQTEVVRRLGLSLNPMDFDLYQWLQTAPEADMEELTRLGLATVDPYTTQAVWKLETTFYWEQTFPPGKEVVVEHRYKPVTGYGFFGDWVLTDQTYREKYCIDASFEAAARKKLAAIKDTNNPYMNEQRVSYILTTANNWASSIKDFRLVVDKGSPDALVSFCGTNVKKIGPTQFEMRATDFYPERELEILIAVPAPPPE